jgi:phospholipid/cholesterol/gamma-HCH transport system ATP-binding protein
LEKAFNGTTVLNGVSFDVFPSDVFTILGGSGCGKSTLLNILIGVEEPTAGTVHILGENIHRLPRRQRKELMREVGVLFQSCVAPEPNGGAECGAALPAALSGDLPRP